MGKVIKLVAAGTAAALGLSVAVVASFAMSLAVLATGAPSLGLTISKAAPTATVRAAQPGPATGSAAQMANKSITNRI